ncbi:MAG: serine/threonine-protein kinase [Nannocystaceae bacterium]|nr:serine/threonine protein kinase [bacterium]
MSDALDVPGLPTRYRIEAPLGRGGQGLTLAALDTATGMPVVVKVFRLAGSEAWKRFELFERECAVLRSIAHPSVPAYVEHGGDEDTGTFWLVMERSPGESLQSMIDRGARFSDAQLDAILRRLLDALAYLHALNPPVIHRDVKPANVVIAADGHVSLVDFGSVRAAVVDTRQSTVVGTYGYMAPEQLRGQSSPASDLYGLGATLAAAATGTDAAKLPSIGLDVDLSTVIKPGPLRDLLQWLLRADPQQRPANVAAVLRPPPATSMPALPPVPAPVALAQPQAPASTHNPGALSHRPSAVPATKGSELSRTAFWLAGVIGMALFVVAGGGMVGAVLGFLVGALIFGLGTQSNVQR